MLPGNLRACSPTQLPLWLWLCRKLLAVLQEMQLQQEEIHRLGKGRAGRAGTALHLSDKSRLEGLTSGLPAAWK